MVARNKGIKADGVHHLGIGLAFEQGVIQCAGSGVARMQLDDILAPIVSPECGSNPRKTTHINLGGHTIKPQLGIGKGIQL